MAQIKFIFLRKTTKITSRREETYELSTLQIGGKGTNVKAKQRCIRLSHVNAKHVKQSRSVCIYIFMYTHI